jgi:NAD(P)-dependent dehydrogenase (short-subunit alcohol dehydrogenase family)
MNTEKRVLLITGASSGIGRACALAAAEYGFHVYAGCRKESDKSSLEKLHPNICPVILDIENEIDKKNIFNLVLTKHGKLDGLFNNAGFSTSGVIEFQSIDKFRKQMDLNFFAPVSLTQMFIPLLREAKSSRIIFTGSAAGLLAKPMMASYCASKFALEGFVDTLRLELKPWNIIVSILEPGKIKTEIYRKTLEDFESEQKLRSEKELELYRDLLKVARYNIENADKMSSDVSQVVDVFMHALTSKKPRTRYPVGGDAKLQAFMAKYLPDYLKDLILLNKIKKMSTRA